MPAKPTALVVGTLIFGLGLAPAARAEDPPDRAGRIAIIEGNVSFRPAADAPWDAAAVNFPVSTSAALWTEPQSRAEIEFDGVRVRLDGATELDITQLDDQTVALSVPQGRVDLSLNGHQPDRRVTVDTPRGTIAPQTDGAYRIFAGAPDSPTRLASLTGQAILTEPDAQTTLTPGQEADISPDNPPQYTTLAAIPDDFDQWSADRDRALQAVPVSAYAPTDVSGAADLTAYGTWRDVPDYGHVWIPTEVSADWQPYHDGRWAYVAPWGWTWIDAAPWGFTPFHYGRWAMIGSSWAWIPRERNAELGVRPIYAPALVAWVDQPSALLSVRIGGAAVGWIPLGPGEPWRPSYRASPDYIRRANIVNVNRTTIVNINNVTVINENRTFVNERHVTVMPQTEFASARPVQAAALRIAPISAEHPIRVVAPSASGAELPRPSPEAFHGPAAGRTPPPARLPVAHIDAAPRAPEPGAPRRDFRPVQAAPAPAHVLTAPPAARRPEEAVTPRETQRPFDAQRPAPQAQPERLVAPTQPLRQAPVERPAPNATRPSAEPRPTTEPRQPQHAAPQAQPERASPRPEHAAPVEHAAPQTRQAPSPREAAPARPAIPAKEPEHAKPAPKEREKEKEPPK